MDLISIITKKPKWKRKINDGRIVSKWKLELSKQNVDTAVLDRVIDLLKLYINKKSKYREQDTYNWAVKLEINPGDIYVRCDCSCLICNGQEYRLGGYYDSEDESSPDEEELDNIKKCLCPSKLIENKKKFLNKFISCKTNVIDNESKQKFKKLVKELESTKETDYHPGSDNQIIDIVHPSLYSYVRGVTQTKRNVDRGILFQWLPSEFSISCNGVTNINSYINNLDQNIYGDLYEMIGNIFSAFVPQFQDVLNALYQNKKVTNQITLPGSQIQVIVKLSNTVLTPQNPTYYGGSWHLEGLPTEKIVATGIYYYEMENIEQNFLNFRSTVTSELITDYPQDCYRFVNTHYGFNSVTRDQECSIDLGKIETKDNLFLVFPNFMQHQVSIFRLIDNKKIGTRKILVFFLVDPSQRIVSTKDVNPQQKGWIMEILSDICPFKKLPLEIIHKIITYTESTMSLNDAKLYRELLMFQRKFEINDQNKFFEREWSLCEH